MINNINFQLQITNLVGDELFFLDLQNLVTDFKEGSAKIENNIVAGSYYKGILQGISLLSTGTTCSFSLPLYSDTTQGVQDKIEEWKTYLNNSRNYRYFLIREQDGLVYRREMTPTDNIGYTAKFHNNVSGGKLNFKFIDNYYVGTEVTVNVPEFTGVDSGLWDCNFEGITKAGTKTKFKITLNNIDTFQYQFRFGAIEGTAIFYLGDVPVHAVLEYDGTNLMISGDGVASYSALYQGSSPEVQVDTTPFEFVTNSYVTDFELTYSPLVGF